MHANPIRRLLVVLTLLGPIACTTLPGPDAGDPDLARLAAWMTGSFSSFEQSANDPDFFDIRLKMVRIWPEREDGVWLYVEQAAASSLEQPYRQRVYRLTRQDETTFVSAVYEFDEPLQYAGVWRDEAPLAELTPDDLTARQGGEIFLAMEGADCFAGSTVGKRCRSDYRGAAYATSEVRVTADAIHSWDRGFDREDRQVWGAVKGGYEFRKIEDF